MILVTGATGNVGRQVVSQLAERGVSARALARDPHSANFPEDVEVVAGDLSNASPRGGPQNELGPAVIDLR
jgi:uncharacterized protein YbjT (DUF2867 family)